MHRHHRTLVVLAAFIGFFGTAFGQGLGIGTEKAGAWLIQAPHNAAGAGAQLLVAPSTSALSGAADRFIPLGYAQASSTALRSLVFPVAGAIRSLKFTAVTQPTGSATFSATVQINGSSTSATCTISVSVATCNWAGSVNISAGDYGDILIHPASSPTSSIISASVGFTPTVANDTVIPAGAVSTFSTGLTTNIIPFTGSTPSGVSAIKQLGVLPDGGTIDDLFVNTIAPGSGKSYAFNLLSNNAATGLTITVSNASTSGNDTTHTASVSAGDYLNFQAVPSGTPTGSDGVFGVRYRPTTSAGAEFAYISNSGAITSNSTTNYISVVGGNPTATESSVQSISHSQTIEKLQVKLSGAPGTVGSGKQYTVTLRINGVNSALSCVVLNTATTCSSSGTIAVADNDLLSISIVPSGTPTAGLGVGTGLLARR